MSEPSFQHHAERARRGQWEVHTLPWDEPLNLSSGSKREQTLSKLDLLDVVTSLYHLKLGARGRLGRQLVRWWGPDEALLSCMEWHDADEQRHVQVLRRLLSLVSSKGEQVSRNDRPLDPSPLWRVAADGKGAADQALLHTLIDEAVMRTLFSRVATDNRIPLVRAVFDAAAQDEARHVDYLTAMAILRFEGEPPHRLVKLHASAVWHVGRLLAALRPYLASFAGATHSSQDQIASAMFGAASNALSDLGEGWKTAPLMRLVHRADSSPWMLWILR